MKTMRKYLALLLSFACALAGATTLNPIQLLNPTGSTSGQTIVSTGASTAPAWGTPPVNVGTVTGTLPIANGGTGATSAATAITNLGAASLSTNTFTGNQTVNLSSAAVSINDTSGTNSARVYFQSSAVVRWDIGVAGFSSNAFALNRYNSSGVYVDTPLTISNSTGATTLGAVSTGALTASGAITPSQTAGIVGTTTNNNANAGSIGEYPNNTTTGTSLSSGVVANIASLPLSAGDWDVQCVVTLVPAGSTTTSVWQAGISTVSATLPAANTGAYVTNWGTTTGGGAPVVASPVVRVITASATTAYCVGGAQFAVSTMTANGFISARRAR